MIVDQAVLAAASTKMHSVQGAALLLLGVFENLSARKPGGNLRYAGPLALLLAGLACFAILLALPGGGSFAGLSGALAARRGFYLFVALACLFPAAGLSGLMAGREGAQRWRLVFVVFVALIAVVYLFVPWRVSEAAREHALSAHNATALALLLGCLAAAAHAFRARVWLLRAWVFLVCFASVQLLFYREAPAAYGPRQATFSVTTAIAPPATNAKSADKERPRN